MSRAVVRVPASSANLGAGFDCVGIAVNRVLTVTVATDGAGSKRPDAARIVRTGTLADLDAGVDDDFIVVGFRAACERTGRTPPAWTELRAHSEIPVARGLGSSAAALVAGAAAANALLGLGLDDLDLVDLVGEIEGHPENAAAAVYGGAVLAVRGHARTIVRELTVGESLAFVFAVPPISVRTASARTLLPKVLPHCDAVHAASKAAALIEGLATADATLLAYALDDVLHVPYRRSLVPHYEHVTGAAIAAGAFGATLSGSGSAVVAVCKRGDTDSVAQAMKSAWRARGIAGDAFVLLERVESYRVSLRSECDPEISTAMRAVITAFTGINTLTRITHS